MKEYKSSIAFTAEELSKAASYIQAYWDKRYKDMIQAEANRLHEEIIAAVPVQVPRPFPTVIDAEYDAMRYYPVKSKEELDHAAKCASEFIEKVPHLIPGPYHDFACYYCGFKFGRCSCASLPLVPDRPR